MQYLKFTKREVEYVALSRDTTETDLKEERGLLFYREQEHSLEELDSWTIVRVSEDLRVIAVGLPVPKYKGNLMEPLLRSRFQARDN
ncbi:von Willebrand factor A domain-containing protein 8-like isoform X4 [Paralichthys olivaceus]|uniref:von Willebrand factor A domain-containing protein 8-like isoform X4 n=1 Tax=Paralichthys olivaceus TaxID=8255 RepID=UPI003752108D